MRDPWVRIFQEEHAKKFEEEIISQNQVITEALYKKFTPEFTNIFGKQNILFAYSEESTKQLDRLEEILTKLTEQTTVQAQDQHNLLKSEIASQNQIIADELFNQFSPRFTNILGEQSQLFIYSEELTKQLNRIGERLTQLTEQTTMQAQEQYESLKSEVDVIDQELKLQLSQVQSKISTTIEDCLTPFTENSQKRLEELDKVIREEATQSHNELIKEVRDQYQLIDSNNQKRFEVTDKEIKASLVQQSDQLKYLQDQIKKVLEITDLKLEDTDKSEDDDLATTAARIAKQPSTRIARIAATQLTMGNKYYDNVNEQSKRSFEIARRLSLVGGMIFIVTITIVILADAFHIMTDPKLLPIGAFITAITELMAGLNFLYDKATKQFGRFHLFIDRIIRSSIAHAMTEEIQDPIKRQLNIEKIVDKLLENDDRIKE